MRYRLQGSNFFLIGGKEEESEREKDRKWVGRRAKDGRMAGREEVSKSRQGVGILSAQTPRSDKVDVYHARHC
jgi:hypothetical protein